ncbi:MAG: hypothetical protein V4703_13445, partial [Actinomycetota bacterium]
MSALRILHLSDTHFSGDGGRHYGVRAFPYPGGVAALIVNRTAEREMARTLHTARATEAALAAL